MPPFVKPVLSPELVEGSKGGPRVSVGGFVFGSAPISLGPI